MNKTTVGAFNVQYLKDRVKRNRFFRHSLLATHDTFICISETGCHTAEEALLWTSELSALGGNAIFSPGNKSAIIYRTNAISIPPTDVNSLAGRIDSTRCTDALFACGDQHYRVIALYAPVQVEAQKLFYQKLFLGLTDCTDCIMMAGDFNNVPDEATDSSSLRTRNTGYSHLSSVLQSKNLVDSYRILYPHKKPFHQYCYSRSLPSP